MLSAIRPRVNPGELYACELLIWWRFLGCGVVCGGGVYGWLATIVAVIVEIGLGMVGNYLVPGDVVCLKFCRLIMFAVGQLMQPRFVPHCAIKFLVVSYNKSCSC